MSRLREFGLELFLPLSMLVAHGKDFLSREEFEGCLKKAERKYFLYLAKSACAKRRASREFWEFHRKGLACMDYSLDWKRLARWLPRALVEKTWEAFWRWWDQDSRLSSDQGAATATLVEAGKREQIERV